MATRSFPYTDIEQLQPKVGPVREKFLSKYNGNILDDTYDAADVTWVKSCDPFVRCVLRHSRTGGQVDKCVDLIDEVLKFRAKWKLSSLKETDLNQMVVKKQAMYVKGSDKQGRKVMYFNAGAVKKGELPHDDLKQFIAWTTNNHYQQNPEDTLAFVFDCSESTISTMDVEISKFIITCNGTYFPEIGAYALMFKMPAALEVVWKVIKTFMNSDQTASTHLVSRKDIQKYISVDQLPSHMIKVESK